VTIVGYVWERITRIAVWVAVDITKSRVYFIVESHVKPWRGGRMLHNVDSMVDSVVIRMVIRMVVIMVAWITSQKRWSPCRRTGKATERVFFSKLV
jgi:hypothetical protein